MSCLTFRYFFIVYKHDFIYLAFWQQITRKDHIYLGGEV